MNMVMAGKTFVFLLIIALIGYSFSIIGVTGALIDSFWKLMALVIALSLLIGYLYPQIRGVRKDDQLAAIVRREATHNNVLQTFFDNYIVTAAENGRIGKKIRVRLWNGKRAEGIITSYAGTLSPATIKLTESEV
ncbi:MAG: hypothetical protein V1835_04740 [Candidatus Micrarchaeota archaeon]